MSSISINDAIGANGEMSFSQEVIGNKIVIEGILKLDIYEQEISTIRTESVFIQGVDVTKEMFGTDDDGVVYRFTAESLHIDADKLNEKLREVKDNG